MRILLAAHGFPPTHSAGAERRAERMAAWLTRAGHDIEVVAVESTNSPDFQVKRTTENGYVVHRLFFDVEHGNHFRNYYDNPRIGAAIRSIIENQKFDLMHIVSGYLMGGQAIHTAHDFGLPVALTITEFWFMCMRLNLLQSGGALCAGPETDEKCMRCYLESKQRFLELGHYAPPILEALVKFSRYAPLAGVSMSDVAHRRTTLAQALNAVDLVICPSQFLIDKFAEYGFDTSDYVYMRQGLRIPPELVPHRPPEAPGTVRLVYIGQIQPHKGVDLLIDAAIRLLERGCPLTLDLWGSEAQSPQYVTELKSRSQPFPAIHWNGRYTGPKVWDVLAEADALVIPSRWYENSPNVILEAFTMHVPVVATNLGGMAELVKHERNGLLFDLDDAADLAYQIERLFMEPDLLPRLQQGTPPVRTIDEEMSELVQHYHQLLNR